MNSIKKLPTYSIDWIEAVLKDLDADLVLGGIRRKSDMIIQDLWLLWSVQCRCYRTSKE